MTKIVGLTVGITLMAAGSFLVLGSIPSAFLIKTNATSVCHERGLPDAAIHSEGLDGRVRTSFIWWPIGVECLWPDAEGGLPIPTHPRWYPTVGIYGGLALVGVGIGALVVTRRTTNR
jgi:hypothetical protein